MFIIAIMDWYSRYVIHWAVSPNMEAEFCVEALRNALLRGRCEIFNTDQGSQFTSKDWISTLKEHEISISLVFACVLGFNPREVRDRATSSIHNESRAP